MKVTVVCKMAVYVWQRVSVSHVVRATTLYLTYLLLILVIGMFINSDGVCLTYDVLHDLYFVISHLVLPSDELKMISATMSQVSYTI